MSDSKYAIVMEIIDSGYVNTGRSNFKCIEERYDNWISILNDLSISYSYFISNGFELCINLILQ